MAGLTDSVLAEVLRRERQDFNLRLLRARHNNQRLSAERVSGALLSQAVPIARTMP